MFSPRFARQISVSFIIDQAKVTKPIRSILSSKFLEKLDIEDRNKTIFEAQEEIAALKLCCDRSKLDNGRTWVEVA